MENYADQTVAEIEAKLTKLEEFQPLGKQYNDVCFFIFKAFKRVGNSFVGVDADFSMYEIEDEPYWMAPTNSIMAMAWNRNKQIWQLAHGIFSSIYSEEQKRKIAGDRNAWSLFVYDEADRAGFNHASKFDQVKMAKANLKAELKAAKAQQAEVAKLIKASEKGAAKAKPSNPYRNAL